MHTIRISQKIILLCLTGLTALFILNACDKGDTPEDQVKQFIQNGIEAVEKRDVSDVKDLIADDYRDDHGYDRQMAMRMLAGYFLGHKNIHVITDIRHIHFPDEQHAEVQLLAGMAGQSASDFAGLFDIRAKVYKFDLRLIRDGDDWQLLNARWSEARREDVFN